MVSSDPWEIANNGDAGVVLEGGDRVTLAPGNHKVHNCTSHHNQRWIMMFAPDIMLAGVGQVISGSEIYGSPHFAVFFQGNDHTLTGSHVHDAGRQCSDCAAFYSGREWTYRGSTIVTLRIERRTRKCCGTPADVEPNGTCNGRWNDDM